MIKNRFHKSTLGLFAEIVIAKNYNAAGPIEDFIDDALPGDVGAFWDDTNEALAAGDTALAVNTSRKFYYAWKQADGEYHRTTGIPVLGRKYSSVAYNAGTAMVKTLTFGGTYSLGQILTVRIQDLTQGVTPYPSYDYTVTIGSGGINAANTAIRDKINAEKYSPIVTATAATNVLTLTAKETVISFDVSTYIETTLAQPTDATAPVKATTVPQVLPIGDNATMHEINTYAQQNYGNPIYNTGMYTAGEFGQWASNVDAAINYGFLMVTNDRTEVGVVHNFFKRNYALIAVATGDEVLLAAL